MLELKTVKVVGAQRRDRAMRCEVIEADSLEDGIEEDSL